MASSPVMTPLDQLKLVPLRNAKVRLVEQNQQRVVLEVAVTYPRWFGPIPRLLKAKTTKRISLDGMSLLMWQRVDDRASLGQIIDWLASSEQLGFNEARLLTLQFLRNLSMRGLIVLGDRTGFG